MKKVTPSELKKKYASKELQKSSPIFYEEIGEASIGGGLLSLDCIDVDGLLSLDCIDWDYFADEFNKYVDDFNQNADKYG